MIKVKTDRVTKILADVVIMSVVYWLCVLMYYMVDPRLSLTDGWVLPVYPVFLCAFVLSYFVFRVYDQMWKFFGIRDLAKTVIAACVAMVIIIAFTWIFAPGFAAIGIQITGYQSALLGMVASISTMIVTVASRMVYSHLVAVKRARQEDGVKKRRLAIVGGGSACAALLSNIEAMSRAKYKPICIFDDDPQKKGARVHGVPIVGATNLIPAVTRNLDIDDILLALPSADNEVINRVVDLCSHTQCKINIMPSLGDIRDESKGNYWKQVRQVKIDDLLGRDPIKFDFSEVKASFAGKVVLVTGGGGSIGSEICRQVARYGVKQLVIMDIYENTTYEIQQELLDRHAGELDLQVEIATMCDEKEMDYVFAKYKPDIVYHAAAHKHVPLMEKSTAEAVKNNIFGTYNVIQAADRHGVKKFIQISTDKAVNPTNVMGATKRFCEMMVQAMKKKSKTQFAAVRFGNVLGSNGSVIPLFRKMIEKGGPVTVTHPDMTRYFMTIPEAVRLVLLAGYSATSGNVYVLDMGKPVKISELARRMIILSGYVPGEDIEIKYTGLRPGEKLYEELIIDDNRVDKTKHEKVFIEKLPEIETEEVESGLAKLREALESDSRVNLVNCIKSIVNTYTPDKRITDDEPTLPKVEAGKASAEQTA